MINTTIAHLCAINTMSKQKAKTQPPKPRPVSHTPWHKDCKARDVGHAACDCPKCEETRRHPG